MWNRLQAFWPNAWVRRKLVAVSVVVAVGVAAFCWGKREAHSQIAPGRGNTSLDSKTDYSQRIVAYIFDRIPVTREDLGDYLIARFAIPERIEYFVNTKIIEYVCRQRNVHVTEDEINLQLKQDLRTFNVTEDLFVKTILKPRGSTLFQYREDAIRTKLALAKLCKDKVKVDMADIKKAFEAKHGEKVDCRWIVLAKERPGQWKLIWEAASKGETQFFDEAKKQGNELAQEAGKMPPIHKHFRDPSIEQAAFRLQEGQVSEIIGLPDGSGLILRCQKRIPADTSKRFEQEHAALHLEVHEAKMAQEVHDYFVQLRKEARPTILVK